MSSLGVALLGAGLGAALLGLFWTVIPSRHQNKGDWARTAGRLGPPVLVLGVVLAVIGATVVSTS